MKVGVWGRIIEPETMLLVSKRWKQTALNNPAIWSRIVFGGPMSDSLTSRVGRFLERAKSHPIHVDIRITPQGDNRIARIRTEHDKLSAVIRPHLERCSYFGIDDTDVCFVELFKWLPEHISHVHVDIRPALHIIDSAETTAVYSAWEDRSFSHLIHMSGSMPIPMLAKNDFPSLTFLELGPWRSSLPFDTLLSLFEKTPNLESLVIHDQAMELSPDVDLTDRTVPLLHLQHLTLHAWLQPWITLFNAHILAPSILRYAVIDVQPTAPSSYLPNLTHLEIEVSWPIAWAVKIFRATPNLHSLTLHSRQDSSPIVIIHPPQPRNISFNEILQILGNTWSQPDYSCWLLPRLATLALILDRPETRGIMVADLSQSIICPIDHLITLLRKRNGDIGQTNSVARLRSIRIKSGVVGGTIANIEWLRDEVDELKVDIPDWIPVPPANLRRTGHPYPYGGQYVDPMFTYYGPEWRRAEEGEDMPIPSVVIPREWREARQDAGRAGEQPTTIFAPGPRSWSRNRSRSRAVYRRRRDSGSRNRSPHLLVPPSPPWIPQPALIPSPPMGRYRIPVRSRSRAARSPPRVSVVRPSRNRSPIFVHPPIRHPLGSRQGRSRSPSRSPPRRIGRLMSRSPVAASSRLSVQPQTIVVPRSPRPSRSRNRSPRMDIRPRSYIYDAGTDRRIRRDSLGLVIGATHSTGSLTPVMSSSGPRIHQQSPHRRTNRSRSRSPGIIVVPPRPSRIRSRSRPFTIRSSHSRVSRMSRSRSPRPLFSPMTTHPPGRYSETIRVDVSDRPRSRSRPGRNRPRARSVDPPVLIAGRRSRSRSRTRSRSRSRTRVRSNHRRRRSRSPIIATQPGPSTHRPVERNRRPRSESSRSPGGRARVMTVIPPGGASVADQSSQPRIERLSSRSRSRSSGLRSHRLSRRERYS